jgi:outer membrane protein assembly factor BamB
LNCRNIADGSLLWSVDTNKEYGVVQNFFGVGSSPLLIDDQVIVMVGGSPPEDAQIAPGRLDRVSPNGTAIVSMSLQNGKELWRCGDDLASYSSPRPMTIDGTTVVLAFARDSLLAIDPSNGKLLWKHDHRAEILESVNAMVPVVSGKQVFISECYDVGSVLLEVSLNEAKVVWSDPPSNRRLQSMRVHWSTPILVDGFLYGCSGRNAPDSDFRCIEFATGKVMWSDDRRTRTSITRVGDTLVLLEERGEMQFIRLNPEKLEVLATIDLTTASGTRPSISYPCWAAPIVVGNKIIVRGDQKVICMTLATE